MNETVRPTKKQREILTYIEEFIGQHGYSPSYREIMNGLNYTSVATVSLHVTSLIRRGHLRKRDRSARSLEVVDTSGKASSATPSTATASASVADSDIKPSEEKWLIDKVESMIAVLEQAGTGIEQRAFDEINTLVTALRVLGLEAAAVSFAPRLVDIRVRAEPEAAAAVPAPNESEGA